MVTAKQLIAKREGVVWTIGPEDTVFEAIRLMSDKGIAALVVMEGKQLVGIMSERDYTRKVALMDRSSKTTRVREIMMSNVITVSAETSLEECMRLMSDHHIRHLPVVGAEGDVIGVVSILDVLRSMLSDKDFEIQQLENYIAGSA